MSLSQAGGIMDTALLSRSDRAKEPVLESIKKLGGTVEAANYKELRSQLGLEGLSLRVIRSALWKLANQDKVLRFYSKRDYEGPQGYYGTVTYGYRLQ